jgi:hypothetical protein
MLNENCRAVSELPTAVPDGDVTLKGSHGMGGRVDFSKNLRASLFVKGLSNSTPTKRQVSKRQVSKRLVSKRRKRQVYKTSGLQNVRFTKSQVFKTSGCKKTSIYILYLWLVEIRRFCCSHVYHHNR